MAGSTDVLLVRHGETDDNAADRFQGQLDSRLNDRGREQSLALADTLAGEGLRALYSSPLSRARETAEIIGRRLGLQPVFDERLMEANTGDWTGLLYAEVIAVAPAEFRAWRSADRAFRFPNGESVAEQAARVAAALSDVRAAGALPALVVTHGGAIRAVPGAVPAGDFVSNGALYRLADPAERVP
jgi:broad specificity phosphatase PhoE